MVNIKYKTGDEFLLKATGHADYAEHGKDIVCAGVSALFFALMKKAEDDMQKGLLFCDVSTSGDEKSIRIYHIRGYYMQQVEQYFDTIICGLDLLSWNYEQYINVERVG